MLFAALRFYKDPNLADKLYWYRAHFAVCEGDLVFAPVGANNRLQKAVVERVAEADREHAPYDVALIKQIVSPCEIHREEIAGVPCTDLGGIVYDEKHYTRYCRISFCERESLSKEERAALLQAGFDALLLPEDGIEPTERATRILLAGRGARERAERVLEAARGKEHEPRFVALARRLL